MKKITPTIAVLAMLCAPAMAAGDKNHIVGVFVGGSNIQDEFDASYGLEYEYKFNQTWGVGPVIEKTSDAHHGDGVTVKLVSLYGHINNTWRFGLGFGEEKVGGAHPHSEDLIRVSGAYDFHVGGFGIAPTVAIDFVDGERAEVIGLAFTKSF